MRRHNNWHVAAGLNFGEIKSNDSLMYGRFQFMQGVFGEIFPTVKNQLIASLRIIVISINFNRQSTSRIGPDLCNFSSLTRAAKQ